MENRNWDANDANNPNEEWISDENRDKQVQGTTEEQLNAAENDTRRYTAKDRDDDDDDDDDNEEEEDANSDWGTIDPLDHPGGLPDPMDPSGPGSAV